MKHVSIGLIKKLATPFLKTGFSFLFFVVLALSVSAGSFTVNTTNDSHAVLPSAGTGIDNSGNVSFRSALEAADAIGGSSTISVPAGTYNLNLGEIKIGTKAEIITINGSGAASTIINMTATKQDRILFINPPGTIANVLTTINNLQFTGGKLTSDLYGGGAICSGGPNNNLTISGCIFSGNTVPSSSTVGGPGGAIAFTFGGTLSIDQSNFNNNSNSDADGGAVFYSFYTSASSSANTTNAVTITNSTFSNNSVTSNGGAGGGALGINTAGGPAGFTFKGAVLTNTFLNNAASGSHGKGGAIEIDNGFASGNIVKVQYNRIVSNTSTLAPNGLVMANAQGSVDANNNWWGCNSGPGVAGACNTAALGGVGGSGTLNVSTWLQLKGSAAPTNICPGSTSTVTFSLLTNSANATVPVDSLVTLIGLPVSYSSALGSFSGASGTIPASGTTSGTFTAGASGGSASVNAQIDNIPVADAIAKAAINISKPVITNPAVTGGTAGSPFDQTFTQTGGTLPVTYSTSSALPDGLTLLTTGELKGTPTVVGSFPITILATDGIGCTGTSLYNLTIVCQVITVTNPSTTTGTVGTSFSQNFTQSNAIKGATFILNSGTLPAGLSLGTDGLLSGTPTQSGNFPVTVLVKDGNLCTGTSATYNLSISCQPIIITNPSTVSATNGTPFSQTFLQSGALGGVAIFSTASSLPSGLALTTDGVLSGTPQASAGTYPIMVKVTDGNGCTGTGDTYNLVINCQAMSVTNPVNASGQFNVPFSENFTESNGIGSVTFSTTSALPGGMTLSSSGVLSGTPATSGSFPIVVTATDANGCSAAGTTYNLIINSCPVISVSNPAVSTGTVGVSFNQAFTSSGGAPTVTYSTGSTLPSGLTLSASGVLSGTPTAAGSFPIDVTATDASSCTGINSTYTLVISCAAPVMVVGSDITQSSDPGKCNAYVTLGAPTVTDACSVKDPVNDFNNTTNASGTYPVGTTIVTWSVSDYSGNTVTGTQKVTVTDSEKPSITVPSDIAVNNDAGNCSAAVNLGLPVTSDNCAVDKVTNDHTSNVYPVGTTTVTWTVTDIHGNSNTAVQHVTVTDAEKPTIVTSDVSVNNDAGLCSASIKLADPVINDNCGTTAPVGVRSDGLNLSDPYPIGKTVITWTETDIHNNVSTTTQNITVTDNENPVISGTPANLPVSNDKGICGAKVSWTPPTATDNCPGVSLTSDHLPGDLFNLGDTKVTYTATDAYGHTVSSYFTITVTDNEKPAIVSAGDQKQLSDPGKCNAYVIVKAPSVSDNCGVSTVTNNITNTSDASGTYPVGTTTITWTVTDVNGNNNTTTQNITVIDNEQPNITAPSDISVNNDAGNCSAAVNLGLPVTSDNCAVDKVTNDHTSNVYPVGTTTVTWTVSDIHGNHNTAVQHVTVTDAEKPTITAKDVSVNNDAGLCSASIKLPYPVVNDNCGTTAPVPIRSDGLNLSDPYPVGKTIVTWTETDIHNNVATTTQNLTVTDNENPVISGTPANIKQSNDKGVCSAKVSWIPPTATDNCPGVTISADHKPGDLFSVGDTKVTYTAIDVHGHSAVTSFIITVSDNEKPIITGTPANISQNNDKGICGAKVSWTAPTATDNCPGVTLSSDHKPGDLFSVGDTKVTYTATDAHGNSVTTSFVVTVTDNEKPTITTTNVTVNNDKGLCSAVVTLTKPVTHDNCDIASVVNDHPSSTYPVGSTTITWTVKDSHGNVNTTTQKIVVNDNEPPVIACPANQVFCANYKKVTTYVIPKLVAKDNCAIASVTYAITGVTARTGTGYDASGIFNLGVSTVTWTVTDIHNNVSKCSFTVKINQLPVASYTTTNQDNYCNRLYLTGSSTSSGPSTYLWKLPSGNTAGTSQVLQLGLTNPDGIYILITTDRNGCKSEFPATFNYKKDTLINTYTILGFREVDLSVNNSVLNGSVGVTAKVGEAELRTGSSIASTGAFLKSPKIDVSGIVNVPVKMLSPATPVLPTMIYNTTSPLGLPAFIGKTATMGTLNGNYSVLYIKTGSNVTLTGNVFGLITIEPGANVTFNAPVVNISSLIVGIGPGLVPVTISSLYNKIHFATNTTVLVKENVFLGTNTILNAENKKVDFFVGHLRTDGKHQNTEPGHEGDCNSNDETSFMVVGGDTKITANVFVPNGTLIVKGINKGEDTCAGYDPKSIIKLVPCSVVYMTGLFIANTIEGDARGTIWNSYDCGSCVLPVTIVTSAERQPGEQETKVEEVAVKELTIHASPNPSSNEFNLEILSNDKLTDATVRVFDGTGRPLQQFNKVAIGSNVKFGGQYSAGMYYAEVVQGTMRKIVKLIKML